MDEPVMSREPVAILGGFMSTPRTYWEMQPALEKLARQEVAVVPTTRLDWLLLRLPLGWSRILNKIERTVSGVLDRTGAGKVILVGHSWGGVIARLYLSPEPFGTHAFGGCEVVKTLVTLGSPHRNRHGSAMRKWIDETCPGSYFSPAVRYVCVAGKAVPGDRYGDPRERAAYRKYRHLCGRGDVWGDGIVPAESAHLDGAENIVLEGVLHDPSMGRPWYGNTRAVREWWARARGTAD